MEISAEGTVGAALSLQTATLYQEKQNVLLRKTLDNQAQTIISLVDSVPKMAASGAVGTKLHEIA